MTLGTQKFSGKIMVDWGTTSLRATLLDAHGVILDNVETQRGIQFIEDSAYEPELMNAIGPWLEKHGPVPVVAFGMITSKNGWVEVPYVSCPATPSDLASGTISRKLSTGSDIIFLAGINDLSRTPFPDVMRGEETQIVGFGLDKAAVIVLPGTHSKWAEIQPGRIERFQTFVTGEIFALLSQHSFIAKAAGPAQSDTDWSAFKKGVRMTIGSENTANPILSLLFSARTGMLCKQLQTSEIRDYISGILIGYEFREARESGWFKTGDSIGVVGNDGLNALYNCAAKEFGLQPMDGGEHAAITGALTISANLDVIN